MNTMRKASFCFDDGFEQSAEKIRAIFETRGISACFCVLSAPQETKDVAIRGAKIASWDFWRDAVAAGHEVAPHGHAHEMYAALEPDAARTSIDACFGIFSRELDGFDAAQSIFHLPYLRAPQELMTWLSSRTLGVRTAISGTGRNETRNLKRGGPIECMAYGPDQVAEAWNHRLDAFSKETGWLVLAFHGLDDEGWGPVSSDDLARIVDRTLAMSDVVLPPNRMMASEI